MELADSEGAARLVLWTVSSQAMAFDNCARRAGIIIDVVDPASLMEWPAASTQRAK